MNPQNRVAILQSSYIPWKGFFDIIHDVDTFVFFDDVQYTTRDWRSRNRVISNGSPIWLSIPAGSDTKRLINEVQLADHSWQDKHWTTIRHAYGKSPYFKTYADALESVYMARKWDSLSEFNQHMTRTLCDLLGINVRFVDSASLDAQGSKTERLVDVCRKLDATYYLSGPAARAYIEPEQFEQAGIELAYKDYSGYPKYPQSSSEFEHAVSVLDLLFNTGPSAPDFIWGWRNNR
ncbi:hypothetical protein TEP_16790 [Stenotrophomonas sp. TEPEL]|uniref:WbqC family protein n=1 Tax=Stenotrophomonas sp. TEPEL TaxID=2283801 RepID=UPI00104CEEE1|nr:WbqC family protein [Stenotrophomonas sp. TEPEL]TDB35157.1 hypothetical protein TEP_16790 [Stenotrophomonas sp. TEPEL]